MNKSGKKIIIANWKMNGLLAESMQNIKHLRMNFLTNPSSCDVVVCPPFTLLRDMAEKLPSAGMKLGAQDCHYEKEGAYTGEVSARMLKDMTCSYVILGHSERRQHFSETSEIVKKKALTAIDAKLVAIICVGETLYERDNNLTDIVLREQVIHSIPENANDSNVIIAYEPVWAIGSGQIPANEQIEKTHSYVRKVIKEELLQFKNVPRVIYGGSTSPDNAKSLLSIGGVDGLLVGKASLDPKQFWKMIESAN